MARTLSAGMQSAVAAESATLVHFVQIESSGGTLRLTTAPQDVSWNAQTWTGIGGVLRFGAPVESMELRGQAVELTLDGVDQTFIATVLNNHVRGREVVIYFGHMDPSAGTVIATPLEVFRGFLNEPISITEQRSPDGREGSSVEVKTRAVSRLADLQRPNAVRTNVHSHRDMLRRAGLVGGALGDQFFKFTAEIANRRIFWGTKPPAGTIEGRTATPREVS